MTKTQPNKSGKKRKGGRKAVAFVEHPDTGLAVQGLRIHKSTGRYYRIEADKKTRHYYPKQGRTGLAYLRRAIYEHECHLAGSEPTTSVRVRSTEQAYDEYGEPLLPVATFDEQGNAINAFEIGKADIANYVREQLSNPATRKEFAELVGIPELQNLQSLPAVVEPLQLSTIIDRYLADKTFSSNQQYIDARREWKRFATIMAVDCIDEITNEALQRYKQALEQFSLRTQKNNANTIQSALNHASAVFKAHRATIQGLKTEFRLNVQNWSQDKKIKSRRANPKANKLKPDQFRKLLKAAKQHSKLAYAVYLSAANFCFHPKEAAELRHQEIDLKNKTLDDSYREKTGRPRVAVIWPETATALRDYLQSDENEQHKEFVFARNGKPLTTQQLGQLHRTLRNKAKLPDTVIFDAIRSMTCTAMGAENITTQKWVMGHGTGELDAYAVREPKQTKQALEKARKAILKVADSKGTK